MSVGFTSKAVIDCWLSIGLSIVQVVRLASRVAHRLPTNVPVRRRSSTPLIGPLLFQPQKKVPSWVLEIWSDDGVLFQSITAHPLSNSNAWCNIFVAFSISALSTTQETRIADVEIIWIFMLSAERVSKIVAATQNSNFTDQSNFPAALIWFVAPWSKPRLSCFWSHLRMGKESEQSNEEGNVLQGGHLKILCVLSHIPRASFPPGL